MTSAAAHQPGALPGLMGIVVWACERMAFLQEDNVKARGEGVG